jgi:nanoRNase/pAp phosphatase (c-di-AMP/oligoRNAs hydrolase)
MLNTQEQIFKQIKKANNILVTFPSDWNPDSVSAALSLFLFLKKIGKNVNIAGVFNKKQTHLKFIPGFSEIKNNLDHLRKFVVSIDISKTKVSQIKYVVEKNQLNFILSPENGWFEPSDVSSRAGDFRYDLIIIIGVNDLESLGDIYDKNIEFFYKTPTVNISCQASNEEFGEINLIDINYSTTSELIFNLISTQNEYLIDENIATALLSGIILQTKNFKTGKLSPETLINTSKLIKLGGRREEIVNNLHKNRRINDLKLWGKILQRLSVKNKTAWTILQSSELDSVEIDIDSLKDLIDELMSGVNEINMMIIGIEEISNNKLIAFSTNNQDVFTLLKKYNPIGNHKIAIIETKDNLKNIIDSLVSK